MRNALLIDRILGKQHFIKNENEVFYDSPYLENYSNPPMHRNIRRSQLRKVSFLEFAIESFRSILLILFVIGIYSILKNLYFFLFEFII